MKLQKVIEIAIIANMPANSVLVIDISPQAISL
jgi:hypothetical protein